jgi:uncharacterized Zn-binding protein involved in type VI secretion
MAEPAAVMGDRIGGQCLIHQVPNPATGAPQPSPAPLPFSAPLLQELATSVFAGGKPMAVQGSWGVNTPPHVGLHLSDPFAVPMQQRGSVVAGSATVLLEGKGAATSRSSVTCCQEPGQLAASATNVLVGS